MKQERTKAAELDILAATAINILSRVLVNYVPRGKDLTSDRILLPKLT